MDNNLLEFVLKDGEGDWQNAEHLDYLIKKLEKFVQDVREKKSPRLIICLPPRHGKSELSTKKFPAWVLGNNPDWEMIIASYSSDLANSFSNTCVNTFNKYNSLKMIESDEKEWRLEGKLGKITAIGVGEATLNIQAHIAIVDDPVKNREEAQSGVKRQRVIDWYKSSLKTRLVPGGGLIVIQTRWHNQDLAGFLMNEMNLGEGEVFEKIVFPAIAEKGDLLGREEGEALWPERFPKEELIKFKNSLEKSEWNSLFQQKPE